MDWEEAGRGWGERAREWAYLFEPYSLPANELILPNWKSVPERACSTLRAVQDTPHASPP